MIELTREADIAHTAYISLGSNLPGDLDSPASQVTRGFQSLEQLPKTKLIKRSSLYQSAAVGYLNQPDFINAVAEISTTLSPLELLDAILNIEHQAGRERPFANAPRVLDCDLLLYDNVQMATEKLTLPHPRMFERAFVLLPLAEIAPNLTSPSGKSVVKLAENYENQDIQKIENSNNSNCQGRPYF
ncbi:MAG: 2-amino-4-hydroxy-6-hydroxymethyldihydropteridine diphosphokinase [Bdellovibrio sp.]|nr:2-amino-4-hydroxy-6-hydroxymethyldihydropteridine diphosphokinase [Methylotenera sp.]